MSGTKHYFNSFCACLFTAFWVSAVLGGEPIRASFNTLLVAFYVYCATRRTTGERAS